MSHGALCGKGKDRMTQAITKVIDKKSWWMGSMEHPPVVRTTKLGICTTA